MALQLSSLSLYIAVLSMAVLLPGLMVQAGATTMFSVVRESGTGVAKPAPSNQKKRHSAAGAQVPTPSVVTGPGMGQAGYVHYWLITAPDGEEEIQVGIELPDQRIAWSFPGQGATIQSFIADGEKESAGRLFRVRHLYGLRPFASDAAMRSLRSNLMRRVNPLVRRQVPYCELNGVTAELCMSCMGFVSQILFPGKTPEYANFPANFPRVAHEEYFSTEGLLLYLSGLHLARTETVRDQRIAAIGGPPELTQELKRLAAQMTSPVWLASAEEKTTQSKPPKRRARAAPKAAPKRSAPPG